MNAGLIVAAGQGNRFGATRPKQFQPLLGEPVLSYSVQVFERSEAINMYGITVPSGYVDTARSILSRYPRGKRRFIIPGGDSRRISVRRGLRELQEVNPQIVLIHDGVRPGVTSELIEQLLEPLYEHGELSGVVPTLPLRDTVKKVNHSSPTVVEETLNRDRLRRVQTPQVFRFESLLEVHENWDPEHSVSDDAMMMEHRGHEIATISGLERNRKITYPVDLRILELYFDGAMEEYE